MVSLYNVYMDVNKYTTQNETPVCGVLDEVDASCDAAIIIGDWNRGPDEHPIARYLACDVFTLADDVIGGSVEIPMHHLRHIDYAISKDMWPCNREQT